jgi:hypothetical protein
MRGKGNMARIRSSSEKTEEIRKEIDSLLGSSLSDEEWNDLVEDFRVDEILRSRSAHSSIVAKTAELVRHRRRTYGIHNKPKSQESRMLSQQEVKQPINRSQVISILVAQEATENAGVRLFRTEVLGNTLLPLEEVEEWIQQQAQKDGPPTTWLSNVPLPQMKVDELIQLRLGITPDTPYFSLEIPIDQIRRTLSLRGRVLQYTVPNDEWVRSVPTSMGGILERLRQLSEQLEEQYTWAQAQAASFVLTGSTPLMSPLSYTLKGSFRSLFNRIVLEIDPVLLPKEVAEKYRILRKEIMPVRQRKLSEKHMQLALFASTKSKSETWASKMAEWNKRHQTEWWYKAVPNFAHDCLQARRRLLL